MEIINSGLYLALVIFVLLGSYAFIGLVKDGDIDISVL